MTLGRLLAIAGLAAAIASNAEAQIGLARAPGLWVGAPAEEYQRLLQLTGVMPMSSLMIRPTDQVLTWTAPDSARWRAPWADVYTPRQNPDTSLWGPSARVTLLDPELDGTYNSAFAYGLNDGAMWAGRGLSTQLTAGARLAAGPVTLQLAPLITWSQNKDFPIAGLYKPDVFASPYSDQFWSVFIDRPQRFGDKSFSRIDPGQSSLTVDIRNTRVGISTENIWWGPGIDNSLIFTNNAGGFPHTLLGTKKPAYIGIGNLEVLYSVGFLKQSDYWRLPGDTLSDDRWLNTLALVFEPRGAPGMYFGASRTFMAYRKSDPIGPRELLQIFQTFRKQSFANANNPDGNDVRDQTAAVWFRWLFPEVGFETYGEYGKTDHNWNQRDLILEPDHARAYVFGARKVFKLRDGILALRGETTDLADARTASIRGVGRWYTNGVIQQGMTQRGQILGAGIGTGSDQQVLAADWYQTRGRIGAFVQRHRNDSDAFYTLYTTADGGFFFLHDVSVTTGLRGTFFAGPVVVDLMYGLQHEYNRYVIQRNDVTNHRLELKAQFQTP